MGAPKTRAFFHIYGGPPNLGETLGALFSFSGDRAGECIPPPAGGGASPQKKKEEHHSFLSSSKEERPPPPIKKTLPPRNTFSPPEEMIIIHLLAPYILILFPHLREEGLPLSIYIF